MQDTEGMTGLVNILEGNCLDILPTLEPASVQCCVTSPPYWGLRDYGTATWDGGDGECEHIESINGMSESNTLGRPEQGGMTPTNAANISKKKYFKHVCANCGARRIDSQLGLEPTPQEYIANMVRVFREVWRVLKDDGTLWVNCGDSYAGSGKGAWDNKNGGQKEVYIPDSDSPQTKIGKVPPGLKPKDLVGIPWRLAFALQADGWYLRSDIIWHKPNPKPESVTDRPTKSHEYIFLLTKQERYFYDADAIKEKAAEPDRQRLDRIGGSNGHTVRHSQGAMIGASLDRNKRTVWTIATQPYSEAHFATFPEDLIKPCIMAGSRVGDTVLDPFAGSGTVGEVCTGLGRKSVLIELNPEYIEMIKIRTNVTIGML